MIFHRRVKGVKKSFLFGSLVYDLVGQDKDRYFSVFFILSAMRNFPSLRFYPVFLLLFAVTASCVSLQRQSAQLAPGLRWQHIHSAQGLAGKQNIHVLTINPKQRRLELAFRTDTFLLTSQFGQNTQALAAMNAGFFKIKEGRGSATYLRVNGQTIDDLPTQGHPRLNGALILPEHGLPRIEYAQPNAVYNAAPPDETVLVTGPLLLLDGQAQALDSSSEFISRRHPRSCLCTTRRGEVLLVTVDGRHDEEALGMSLFELTNLLKKLRCRKAINLDGGGSTTLWIRGQPDNGVVNCPSDNGAFDNLGERPVGNVIVVH